MNYPTDLFTVREGERAPFSRLELGSDARQFLELLPDRIAVLQQEVGHIVPGDELEDRVEALYRQNHIVAGMARIHGLRRIDHLLEVLDFAIDVARSVQVLRQHSIDYLINLFYGKIGALVAFELSRDATAPDVGDLVDEAGNYLLSPLTEWNRRLEDARLEPEAEVEPPAVAPVVVTTEVPSTFDDSPEPLNLPSDKVGLLSDFFEENSEILAQFANGLVELESVGDSPALVQDLFRMIHTFKGGARMMHIRKMEALSHVMESVLDRIRQGTARATAETIDLLLEGKNLLGVMLKEAAARGPFQTLVGPLIARIEVLAGVSGGLSPEAPPPAALPPSVPNASSAPEKEKEKAGESLRISSEKLDEVLNTASEIFIGRIRFQNEISSLGQYLGSSKAVLERVSEFDRFLPSPMDGELTLQEELNLNHLTLEEIQKQLQKNVEILGQLSTRLQNGAMSFRMVPISSLLDRFPQQLRDLARTIGKKVKVQIVGGETELDKVLINRIADPLLHMLRNSIDHGIELPEARVAAGKPEVGTITLETYYHGSHAVIEVRDDGRGIDLARVEQKGRERGLVPLHRTEPLSEAEILELLFLPGFSTNDQVTELSGRGVGMDVVKTAIHQLQGTIETQTTPGQGTRFRLKLPLTLAIVKILLVQESSRQFALPILNIETLLTIAKTDLQRIDHHLFYNHHGRTLPVTSLSTLLDFSPSVFSQERVPLVILSENSRLMGILVDTVIGRQEILIKNLGNFLKKVPFVMGCTILQDSRLVQILDPRQVLDAVRASGAPPLLENKGHEAQGVRPTLLIVDDSSIQRENLKTILKSPDYLLETAENGFDALKLCRKTSFAALFVDIIMPLMDGYEFVERLRKIPAYASVPVYFISGKQVEASRIAGLGVTKVFRKPVDRDELLASLKQARILEARA